MAASVPRPSRSSIPDAAREVVERVKPRLRGVSHEWAAFFFAGLGVSLIVIADGTTATVAAAIYAVSVVFLFATSAIYHRIEWKTASARRVMRRLDHSMIFFLIAGSWTPFALLALEGTIATVILVTVWAGALAGVVMKLAWIDAPKWVTALVYVALGWVVAIAMPGLVSSIGVVGSALVGAGGLLYTAGAIIYALQRPDPRPEVFGYHEIFHLLVILAAALQYAAVAFYVLPRAA